MAANKGEHGSVAVECAMALPFLAVCFMGLLHIMAMCVRCNLGQRAYVMAHESEWIQSGIQSVQQGGGDNTGGRP